MHKEPAAQPFGTGIQDHDEDRERRSGAPAGQALTFCAGRTVRLVGQQRLDRLHYLPQLGKAPGLMLRVDQVSVHRDLEGTASAGYQCQAGDLLRERAE